MQLNVLHLNIEINLNLVFYVSKALVEYETHFMPKSLKPEFYLHGPKYDAEGLTHSSWNKNHSGDISQLVFQ